MGADSQGASFNRSFISTTAYNTGASPAGLNWQLGLVTRPPAATKNSFLINSATTATLNIGAPWCFTFWGTQVGQRTLLFFSNGGGPTINLNVPVAFTTTGGFFTGPRPETFSLCASTACGFQLGPLSLCLIYQDFCDLKPNNKPKLRVSNTATLTTEDPDSLCIGCYGTRDDGDHDGFVWKAHNPSGPSDWFVVNLGTARANTAAGAGNVCVTSVEVCVTETCTINTEFAQAGYHPIAPGVDENVTITPDLGSGSWLENILVPANVTSDSCYPGQVYTLPSAVPITPGGSPSVAAVRWTTGDSCIWRASDTDGTDQQPGCGAPLPNNFSASSRNSFATNTMPNTAINWAIKVNWSTK